MKYNRIVPVFFALALIAGTMVSASAQTQSREELIRQLQEQMATLQARIKELRAAEANVAGARQDASKTAQLLVALREGMSGDDVKILQAALAADSNIYPEGLITGYYGKLTSAAVKRFQKKHGVDQVGSVGPRTLEKLNGELKKNKVALEDDDDGDDDKRGEGSRGKRPCAVVPPGHLIAPGWLKKQNGLKPLVPPCQVLPPGIDKKIDDDDDDNGTTTPPVVDVTAPVLSAVTATSTTATTTRISWLTNEVADSAVWYATSSPVLSSTSLKKSTNSSLVLSHIMNVSNLRASTTYYYFVVSRDGNKNAATSSQFTVVTQ